MPFKSVSTKVDFPSQEREVLLWWQESDAFNKLRQLRASSSKRYSFLDGPITANNPMGVHHAWGRTYKDVWQRYHAMLGFNERWQNGFDCQGLWVEVNVEKDLGFKSKRDIEEYGLAPFVLLCKQRVLNYAAVQTQQSIRLGYWVNWDDPDQLRMLRDKLGSNPNEVIEYTAPDATIEGTVEQVVGRLGVGNVGGSYFTFSDENNYQIWGFLKKCFDQGWIYKGHDVMPWCYRCGTGISQHEIVTEGYVDKIDPGLTVRFPLVGHWGDGETKESLLVWTTTPWTLTSNVAAAVGPDMTYVKVKQGDETFYMSKGTTKMLKGKYDVVGEIAGREMEGWQYLGPFDELPIVKKSGAIDAHKVILWEEVSDAEGTGIVHIAPGCGQEDFALSKRYNLPVIAPLDESGFYIDGFDWLTGLLVVDVKDRIVEALKVKGRFYRIDDYNHRYPVCWRCQTPLVFRLVDEWYISMDGLRQPMMDVTNQMRWIPEFGKDRELDWLRNMHDWMISKKRYWGLALPIYECKKCRHFEVMGSQQELQARAVEGWAKFQGHTPHRPYIDAVKIKCSNCGTIVERIKDVGNPWLDAGIVSMSTMGSRIDPEYWQKWFPADFITESFPGQFRNWFYSLLAMSTAVTGQMPTKTVLGFATLLGEDARAMHKSLGNSIEFNEAADKIGADVMRWMFANQRYETDMLFGLHLADETRRRFFIPLWNVYSFFVTYANLDHWEPVVTTSVVTGEATKVATTMEFNSLDKWILARLQALIAEMTAGLEDYDLPRGAKAAEEFVDDLSNWYVRRSRRRFWRSESDADKQAAYSTLYTVLVTLTKLLAPIIPFVTETLYQNLVRSIDPNAPESVHHCDWPQVDRSLLDQTLLDDVALSRSIVALGHSIRSSNNIKVRQPLARAFVVVNPAQQASVMRTRDIIADELNVKDVELAEHETVFVTYQLLPDNKKLGPKYGSKFSEVRAVLKWAEKETIAPSIVQAVRAGEHVPLKEFKFAPDEILIVPKPREGWAIASENGVVVALDIHLSTDLLREGLAREVVRRVQDMRKNAGFEISDHITLTYQTSGEVKAAIDLWASYIQSETLADEMIEGEPRGTIESDEIDGVQIVLGVQKK
jgi:isoleucyl-tRNA synthetase